MKGTIVGMQDDVGFCRHDAVNVPDHYSHPSRFSRSSIGLLAVLATENYGSNSKVPRCKTI